MKEFDELVENFGLDGLKEYFSSLWNPDMSTVLYYMTKEDGSLISSFEDKGYLGLKSKTSVHSDQVHKAMAWMNTQHDLKSRVLDLAKDGFTVNFEYCGPDNRIVLNYDKAMLRILNIRNNKTGEYVPMDEIFADAVLRPYMVDVFDSSECSDEWVSKVRGMSGIEGYILVFPNLTAKLKTDWYVSLHHTKDSINSNRRLLECLVENSTDDLRGMFSDDKVALQKIDDFEKLYVNTIGEWFRSAKTYHTNNFHKERGDYARGAMSDPTIKTQGPKFILAMELYKGMSDEAAIEMLKTFVVKNIDMFVPKMYS